jgi:hypothetical protein
MAYRAAVTVGLTVALYILIEVVPATTHFHYDDIVLNDFIAIVLRLAVLPLVVGLLLGSLRRRAFKMDYAPYAVAPIATFSILALLMEAPLDPLAAVLWSLAAFFCVAGAWLNPKLVAKLGRWWKSAPS